MSEFPEACRREWRRLGVPDPIAEEMAVDLETDLEQTEAEGVATERLLGSGPFDPPGFATAIGAALTALAFHGASLVAVAHAAPSGPPVPPLHGFTQQVGPLRRRAARRGYGRALE